MNRYIQNRTRLRYTQGGFTIPAILSIMIAAGILGTAVLMVIVNNFFVVGNNIKSQQAFNIAEAGINYYLWHMSHNPTDYQDGTGAPSTPVAGLGYGPYVHNYVDDNAKSTGTYTLYISPQGSGSTIVNIRAIGKVTGSSITRTVQAQIGAASFASYAVASDTSLWFGNNETAGGPVFSNQGIRMDGSNASTVSAANTTYVPSSQLGGDGSTSRSGVWCDTTVTTPVNCNTRSKTDWLFPQASIDFNQVSSSLCTIKKIAFAANASTASLAGQANACSQVPATRTSSYLPQRNSTFSTTRGYLVELNADGTYNLYNVNSEDDSVATGYTGALSKTSVATNIAIPSSGVIFAEDNVWVRSNPTYHGRVTIAAGRLATSNNADIHIASNLVYSTKNGQDAIGLVAENNIILAPYAPTPTTSSFTFEVDAAMLAQSGSVLYPSNYAVNGSCSRGWINSNQKLLVYGSVASRQSWTWSWINGNCGDTVYDPVSGQYISGFLYNTTQYDYNLLYAPPPSYPITGGYNILSWREVLTHP